jgi:Na+/melibiose symporter-like transporter
MVSANDAQQFRQPDRQKAALFVVRLRPTLGKGMRMFLRNLNLFFPYFMLSTFFVGDRIKGIIFIFFHKSLSSLPVTVGAFLFNYTAAIIIALALIIVWWRVGLLPRQSNQEKERRFNNGQKLIAAANFLTLAYILFSYITLHSTRGPATFLAALLLIGGLIVLVSWVAGVIMIWSSR